MFVIYMFKNKLPSRIFLFFFVATLFTFSLYGGPRFPHYFGSLFPLYYVTLSYCIAVVCDKTNKKMLFYLSMIVVLPFIMVNAKSFYFINGSSSDQVGRAKKIATIIFQNITDSKYRLTSLPQPYSDTTYRYFLESWGKRPIEKDSIEKSKQMFVVCNASCNPMEDGQFDIALFAPKHVEKKIKVDTIWIYKLSN